MDMNHFVFALAGAFIAFVASAPLTAVRATSVGQATLNIAPTDEGCVTTADRGQNFRFYIERNVQYTFTFTGVTTSECTAFDPAQGLAFIIKNVFGDHSNLCLQTAQCTLISGLSYKCVADDVVYPSNNSQPCGSTRPILYCASNATVIHGSCGDELFAQTSFDILPDASYSPNSDDTSTHLIPASFPEGCQQGTQDTTCDHTSSCCFDAKCPNSTTCIQYFCDEELCDCGDVTLNCDDHNKCTTDLCDDIIGCMHSQIECNDHNSCTHDQCDETVGCEHIDISDTCNSDDKCKIGSCNPLHGCVYTNRTCNDNNKCTEDSCDSIQGCVFTDISSQCDSGDKCSTVTCNPELGCISTNKTCDDSDKCTEDRCDSGHGCVHTNISATCSVGDKCRVGTCVPAVGCVFTDITCDDSNKCTADICDSEKGCVYTDISAACTSEDKCKIGSCNRLLGCMYQNVSCNDRNKCTNDTCNSDTGCEHVEIACDDRDECTVDSCSPVFGCQHVFVLNEQCLIVPPPCPPGSEHVAGSSCSYVEANSGESTSVNIVFQSGSDCGCLTGECPRKDVSPQRCPPS